MIMQVRVVLKSSKVLVKKENDYLKVYLTKPACEGLANKQLIELLADYLKIKKYRIEIIKGHKSKNKVIKISDA